MRRRVCAAIIRQGHILMVRHRHDGREYWTLPGGGIEAAETPQSAVLREVAEETGLRGEVIRCLYRSDREWCYLVSCAESQEPLLGYDPELGSDEQMLVEVAWRPLDELHEDRQVRHVLAALESEQA